MSISIEPITETQTTTFTLVDVFVQAVTLGVSANIRVICYTSDYNKTLVKDLVLEQPEYNQWGADDQFVIDWALAQIGAVPVPK